MVGEHRKFTPTTAFKRLISPYVFICVVFLALLIFFWATVLKNDQQNGAKAKFFELTSAFHEIVTSKPSDLSDNYNYIEASATPITRQISQETSTPLMIEMRSDHLPPLQGEKLSDRWIVVTSIQLPTDDVKLLGLLEKYGWRVLVIGDMSTPSDWKAPPGVRFLSYQEATTLGYNLLAFQRWKTYSIKNIGYLFAIQHGAKIIYDTDDDNHPTDDVKHMLELAGFINGTKLDLIRGLVVNPENVGNSLPVINTLPHFGQSSLWPRGFPLAEVARPAPRSYKICTTRAPAWIQGVVNGDPDMDAIFRLTRKHFNTPIDLTFDHAPPIVIPQRFFVQSNSQNTFFTQQALGLLFFPFSKLISMRETDIWRAYIGQPLLWLVGGRKGYVWPNAFQARNPHDYLKDFNDEINLYKFSGQLIDFLSKWQCPAGFDFGRCFVKIYEDLSAQHLIAAPFDVESAKAWISDLRRMNFEFPPRQETADCIAPGAGDERLVQFYPIEQPVPLPATAELNRVVPITVLANSTSENCSTLQQLVNPIVAPNVATLAVFIGKTEIPGLVTERLNLLYAPYFARRIFCVNSDRFSHRLTSLKVTLVHAESGVDCLKQVIDLHMETSIFVLLSISEQSPVALLSPNGIETTTANSSNAKIQAGACDKSGDPSVVIASYSLVSSLTQARLRQLCKTNESGLTTSLQCSLSESASILSNCQALSGLTWTPPFCRI